MVTIVTPAAYDNPCSEVWVDPANLSQPDLDIAEQAALSATYALWLLSGEQFHGPQCWIEEYRTSSGFCTIQLKNGPVASVAAVSRVDLCGDAVPSTGVGDVISGYCYRGNGEISVCCNSHEANWGWAGACGCPSTGSVVRVHYTTANNVPAGADLAALRLAEEYLLAYQGKKCALPERITSITRQNVSWTILDPQDFLQEGLTGIGPVDAWLAQAGLKSRWFRFTDPLKSAPLVSSTLYGCGEDDCFAELET